MGEDRKTFKIKDGNLGEVKFADEVVAIIAGLAAPDAGHVTLLGNNVFDDSGAHADAYRSARHGIGAVFQHPEDQIVTTITEDDVAFGPENLAIAHDDIDMRIAMSLDAVDMSGQREADPTRMSGGQQQRVACARAIMERPSVIFADEPTGNLDSRSSHEVFEFLRMCVREYGQTIVMVTHDPRAASFADRVLVLSDGSIVQDLDHPSYDDILAVFAQDDDPQNGPVEVESATARSAEQ